MFLENILYKEGKTYNQEGISPLAWRSVMATALMHMMAADERCIITDRGQDNHGGGHGSRWENQL